MSPGRPPRIESARAKYPKPAECRPCPLFERGRGYVPADGSVTADILFVGETPWVDEIVKGIPFAGAAGAMIHRMLRRNFMTREQFRWENVIRCAPPHMEFAGTNYEHAAAHHCRQYFQQTLDEQHKVIVPLGGSALKHVLDLHGGKIKVEDFHGTVSVHETGALVVPTFHPSHIQRGATNMTGTWSWDLQRALEVAKDGWVKEDIECIIDPPLDWFTRWVDDYLAAATQSPMDFWCAVDIETLEKAGRDEDALGPMTPEMAGDRASYDRSYTITRLNLACHPDQGITIPWVEPYITQAKRALASPGVKLLWNEDYDLPRLHAQDAMPDGPCWDLMEAWHLIQSDIPRSLGFVSPFHSGFGPWKHLSESEPERYAAIDGPQTLRNGYGIVPTLEELGLWDVFQKHWYQLKRQVLQPAHVVGIQVDKPALDTFIEDMSTHCRRLLDELQDYIPDSVLPLTGERKTKPPDDIVHTKATTKKQRGGEKKHKPDELKMELYKRSVVVEKLVLREVWVCKSCGAIDVTRKHKCQLPLIDGAPDKTLLSLEPASVTRWFWKEPFNPDSAPQIISYIKASGHQPGRAKKTGADTGNRETLQRLGQATKDPFYEAVLVYRSVQKVRSTYGIGIRKRLDADDRIHPVPTFKPSTQRQSYQAPNIQNVISDKNSTEDKPSLAAGFRKCIVAAPGCRLLEVDYRGIEAVQVGWFSRDPDYIRLAKLGVHAALASHVLGRPYEASWSDSDLVDYFYEIKSTEGLIYSQTKTVVHGVSYGRTPHGMHRDYPELFPTLKDAQRVFDIFYEMAPAIPRWQHEIRQHVDKHGFLGGPGEPPFGHPYNYRHYYYGVFTYERLAASQAQRMRAKYARLGRPAPLVDVNGIDYKQVLGDDAKRLVAFPPQSTASANLKDAELILFGDPHNGLYLGDVYYGQTCLRAPIHDSLLLEYPIEEEERVLLATATAMCRPILQQPLPPEWGMGEHLTIGVEAKASAVGGNWMEMETIDLPMVSTPSLAADRAYFPIQDGLREQGTDEWEEWMDLGKAMGHLPLRASSAPASS